MKKLSNQRTLFDLSESEAAASTAPEARPFDIPGSKILLGTSSFTASGWQGSFYPAGLQSRDYLSFYAKQFAAVEIDSTFYGTPAASTVSAWYAKTPPDFLFAVKVPQIITHEKVMKDCEAETDEFLGIMQGLKEKLGPMLLQFPKFDKWTLKGPDEFLARLRSFLKRVPAPVCRFAVEIRNKDWINAQILGALREHRVALALTDTTFVPRPWEMKNGPDLVTADFAYVRWLGDRKGIEQQTTTWDKTVVDRQQDLRNWVDVFRSLVSNTKVLKIFAFANNHYGGHAPSTAKQFQELWNEREDRR